jgi:hypothetical protein
MALPGRPSSFDHPNSLPFTVFAGQREGRRHVGVQGCSQGFDGLE